MRTSEVRGGWRKLSVAVVVPTARALMRRTWSGQRHIPRTGGVVVACNHLSVLDPIAVARYVYGAGRYPCFLGKESVFRVPVMGGILRRVGQIPVYRESARASQAFRAAVAAVRAGACIVVYPEATVTRDPRLWPMSGKTGAARIAIDSGAPVVPLATWGAQQLWPYHGKPHLWPRGTVRVTAGAPVDLAAYREGQAGEEALRAATSVIMHRIAGLVAEMRGEPAPDELYDRRNV